MSSVNALRIGHRLKAQQWIVLPTDALQTEMLKKEVINPIFKELYKKPHLTINVECYARRYLLGNWLGYILRYEDNFATFVASSLLVRQ